MAITYEELVKEGKASKDGKVLAIALIRESQTLTRAGRAYYLKQLRTRTQG